MRSNVALAHFNQTGGMNVDFEPRITFGRRSRESGAPATRPDGKTRARPIGHVVILFGLAALLLAVAAAILWTLQSVETPHAQIVRAERR